MNRIFAIVFTATVFISACNSGPEADKILNAPPFASITDSIKRFPDRPELYLTRALRLSQNNLHSVATPDYKKAWELAQEEVTALQYASNLILVNQTDEAVKFLIECRKKFPENYEIGRRLSEVYATAGKPREAMAEYDKMLAVDSGNFMIWFEKGKLQAKLKDTASAIASLEKSFSIQPLYYSGLDLAELYSNQNNPRVLEICDILIARDSAGEMLDPRLLKGIYYSVNKRYEEALPWIEQCIAKDWKFDQAHIEKGILWYRQNDFNKALESFKVAATVKNTNGDAYFWMARCYEELKNKELAVENYETALTFDPSIDEAREALSRLK